MTNYERELQRLKPHDEVQNTDKSQAYHFIYTAGHGYLIVPRADKHAALAEKICEYGYKGRLAYYLEEDCEAPEFLKVVADEK